MDGKCDHEPPNDNFIDHATPQPRNGGAELRSIDLQRVVIEQIPQLVVHCQLLVRPQALRHVPGDRATA